GRRLGAGAAGIFQWALGGRSLSPERNDMRKRMPKRMTEVELHEAETAKMLSRLRAYGLPLKRLQEASHEPQSESREQMLRRIVYGERSASVPDGLHAKVAKLLGHRVEPTPTP